MGRYRRGHKNKNRGRKHSYGNTNGDSSASSLTEADWLLLEKYLLEYRSTAFKLHGGKAVSSWSRVGGDYGQSVGTTTETGADVVIGTHKFLPLTKETCQRPYIDLPYTLGGKERRKIHALCSTLDLYHAGTGESNDTATANTTKKSNGGESATSATTTTTTTTTNESTKNMNGVNTTNNPTLKRRIAISIYADGLYFVPDLPSPHVMALQSFPSRRCQPWYYHGSSSSSSSDSSGANKDGDVSHNNNNNNYYGERIQTLEAEKRKIRQFANLPEQSLRTSNNDDDNEANPSFCDSLDMNELDSLDLSMVPTPEETPWMLVDTVEKLKLCVEELMYGVGGGDVSGDTDNDNDDKNRVPKIHELAFDLEMANILDGNSRYENKTGIRTCLLQLTSDVVTTTIATEDDEQNSNGDNNNNSKKDMYKDYIIDPLAPGVWDAIPIYLGPLFSNPAIVKIGHGIGGMDTSSLHHDFGILVVNAFDTYEASTILRHGKKGGMGLATLCRHYGLPSWEHYKALKSKYQASDWKRRPLDDDALAYGRYDIRFLVTLRKLLMRDLVKLDMIGVDYKRFGSSVESDSEFETSQGGTPLLHSSDSQLGGTMSSTVSSISENEISDTAPIDQSMDVFKDAKEEIDESTVEETEDVFVDSVENHDDAPPPSSSSPTSSIIRASEFPCHNHLMKAISISQKRCLKLWNGDEEEPILKNPFFISMIKQAANQKGHGKHWTDANTKLYQTLYAWRRVSARREKVHSSEVCSLDFLVHVAYKLPIDRWAMRRHSYFLPMLLEDESLPYCEELVELVISSDVWQQREKRSGASGLKSVDVVFYSGEDAKKESNEEKRNGVWKLMIAGAVVGAILLTMTKVRRR
mmetsp:Transcript_35735/g.66200  ORF Transcript_35735/g.66200 Transcript_35735/m.66200 type:complete len:865 (-) Transcript_35735:102-2696(-)